MEELLPDLEYDICVIPGDYRGVTFGLVIILGFLIGAIGVVIVYFFML